MQFKQYRQTMVARHHIHIRVLT